MSFQEEDIFSQIDTAELMGLAAAPAIQAEIDIQAESEEPAEPIAVVADEAPKKRGRKPKALKAEEAKAPEPPAPLDEKAFFLKQEAEGKRVLASLDLEIAAAKAKAEAFVVNSAVSKEEAVALMLPLEKTGKEIEKARKRLVEEPYAYMTRINNFAKSLKDKISGANSILQRKILDYDTQIMRERAARQAEAARKAQEEAARLAEEAARRAEAERLAAAERQAEAETPASGPAEADFEASLAEASEAQPLPSPVAEIVTPLEPEPPKTVRTMDGAASTVKRWEFRIVDPSLVPREFMRVDESLIRAAVKQGVRSIEGVEIFEALSLRFKV